VSLDYGRQDVTVFSVGGGGSGVPSVNPQIGISKPPTVPAEPLQAELKSFLAAVREHSKPMVSLEQGRNALEVALDIVAAIARHGKKANLDGIGTRG
jgi:predicted dehydrogenase